MLQKHLEDFPFPERAVNNFITKKDSKKRGEIFNRILFKSQTLKKFFRIKAHHHERGCER